MDPFHTALLALLGTAAGLSAEGDCTKNFCQLTLSDGLLKRYKISLPGGNSDGKCGDCKITVQLELDGYSWIGFGVSGNGGMVGSHVVIGEPGLSEPKAYYLNGKKQSLITRSDILLEDATIDFINEQTVMEFTTTFASLGVEPPIDDEPAGISLDGTSTFIWAHGKDGQNVLEYHGSNKNVYELNGLTSGAVSETHAAAMTMSSTTNNYQSKWVAHGILAFISWGICAPIAIAAALLRDAHCSKWLLEKFTERLAKWWFYVHVGCNSLNYFFTLVVFSLAVSTIGKEGGARWSHKHSKMGLAMFLLVNFQIMGGLLRPELDKTKQSKNRELWELSHSILGITLFIFSMWQMYAGMVLFNRRYGNSNFTPLVFIYAVWMGSLAIFIVGETIFKYKKKVDEAELVEKKVVDEHMQGNEGAAENELELKQTETSKVDTEGSTSNALSEADDSGKVSDAVYV